MKTAYPLSLLIAVILCTGCNGTQTIKPLDVELSNSWRNGPTVSNNRASWWRSFGDQTLDALEQKALSENLDVLQAESRIEQSRSLLGLAETNLMPNANLSTNVGQVKQSLNSGLGVLSNYVPNFKREVSPGQIALAGSWDADFTGSLRHQREASKFNVEASVEELNTLRLSISTEIADAYFTLLALTEERSSLSNQINSLKAQLKIMAARSKYGAAPSIDVDRLASALEESSAPLQLLDTNIEVQRNRLALLLGQNATTWNFEFDKKFSPKLTDPTGDLPAAILRNRPDVLAAEKRLLVANENVSISIAEYYPKFSLSVAFGQDSNNYATLDNSRSSFTQSFLGVKWRLFDFGRIDAEVAAAQGKKREMTLAYKQSVLRAVTEVENSFTQLASSKNRLAMFQEEGARNTQVMLAVKKSYEVGASSEDELLSAKRNVYKADFDITSAKLDLVKSLISAARSLGGPV